MKQGISVVVVDDKEGSAYATSLVVQDYLEERGLESDQVYTFSFPTEAFRFISNQVIDVLVTDLQMPVMNGDELIRQVGAISPITTSIIMTAKSNYQPPAGLDVVGVLEKPFQEDDLFGLLDDATECIISNTDILEE